MHDSTPALARPSFRGRVASFHPRLVPSDIVDGLRGIHPGDLPRMRFACGADGTGQAVAERLPTAFPGAIGRWLADDVAALAEWFASAAGCGDVSVRLEGVTGDGCSRFHVDRVRLRLATTYLGPGTEWLEPGWSGTLDADGLPPPGDIRRLPTGHVLLMRGSAAGGTGLLHRSPPLSGSGGHRLFLALDACC